LPRAKRSKFNEEGRQAPLTPLNENQAVYLNALKTAEQLVVTGPAGTGKTFIASTIASQFYREGVFDKIILTRPNIPAGRSIGFFPGTLEEKMANWVVPFTSVIRTVLGPGMFDTAVKNGNIEVIPFEVMRGRSWDRAFIVLDEAQNTTIPEIKMFLTRQGNYSRTVINGDIRQSDLKENSGLAKMIHLIKSYHLPVPIIEFTVEDIVRSDICKEWVKTFMKEGI
jgi:phosphate starvation-inducible protein PhoH and related proteins